MKGQECTNMEFKDVVLPRRQAVPDRCLII